MCVARNVEIWLAQFRDALAADAPKDHMEETLLILHKAIAYMADASVEAVRCSECTSALINVAHRALLLKTWQGDIPSKLKLCAIPLAGELMYGPELETWIGLLREKRVSSS